MAEGLDNNRERIVKVFLISFSAKLKFSLELKNEPQYSAIDCLLNGNHVLAVLPTGYGKSHIYQILVLVNKIDKGQPTSALVVCPLRSIVDDQVQEVKALRISGSSFNHASSEDLKAEIYRLIFGSSKNILYNFDLMKEKNLVAIVVDESHTVEIWTGEWYIYIYYLP